MVEQSSSVLSFFLTNAAWKPLLTKTLEMEMKTVSMAMVPYASGPSNLARMMEKTKVTTRLTTLSAAPHANPFRAFSFNPSLLTRHHIWLTTTNR